MDGKAEKEVGLHDQGRAGLAVIAGYRDQDKIATPDQGSGHS